MLAASSHALPPYPTQKISQPRKKKPAGAIPAGSPNADWCLHYFTSFVPCGRILMTCVKDSDRAEWRLGSEVTKHKCVHRGIAMCSSWLQPPKFPPPNRLSLLKGPPLVKSNTRTLVIKPAWPHTTFKIGIGLTFDLPLNKPTLKFAGLLLKVLLIYSGFQYPSTPPTHHSSIVQSGVLTPECPPHTSPPWPCMPVLHSGGRGDLKAPPQLV